MNKILWTIAAASAAALIFKSTQPSSHNDHPVTAAQKSARFITFYKT